MAELHTQQPWTPGRDQKGRDETRESPDWAQTRSLSTIKQHTRNTTGLAVVLPDIERLDVGINAGNSDGEELHRHVGVWGELVLPGVCHRQVNVLLLGDM